MKLINNLTDKLVDNLHVTMWHEKRLLRRMELRRKIKELQQEADQWKS